MTTFSQGLAQLLARDHDRVGDKGRTIARVHAERRPRAIVLLHGMTASPAQFDRFASELFERGHNVLVPRLPRHGHADRLSPALERLRPSDLYAAGANYVEIARELGERVTVAGFSFGGLLAAWIAQHHEVDRAVVIAPLLGVAWVPGRFITAVAEALLRLPNRFHWWDPLLREKQLPAHGYPRYSTHAVAHAFRLASQVLRDAHQAAPLAREVVLVANSAESTVDNRAIARLYRAWRTNAPQSIEFVMLEGLPRSHDIVEPLHYRDLANRAYPFLLSAIDPESAVE